MSARCCYFCLGDAAQFAGKCGALGTMASFRRVCRQHMGAARGKAVYGLLFSAGIAAAMTEHVNGDAAPPFCIGDQRDLRGSAAPWMQRYMAAMRCRACDARGG